MCVICRCAAASGISLSSGNESASARAHEDVNKTNVTMAYFYYWTRCSENWKCTQNPYKNSYCKAALIYEVWHGKKAAITTWVIESGDEKDLLGCVCIVEHLWSRKRLDEWNHPDAVGRIQKKCLESLWTLLPTTSKHSSGLQVKESGVSLFQRQDFIWESGSVD